MIHRHAELYGNLIPAQSAILWRRLHSQGLVAEPPTPGNVSGEMLAWSVQHLSHAEVVMTIASCTETVWCDILDALLQQPVYLCARGETSVPLTDIAGRPLPLPVGRRRGQPVGAVAPPKAIVNRIQYQRRRDPRIITLLAERNPKSGASRERFALYRTGMSVSEYIALGGWRSDIAYDADRGFIRLDLP